MIRGYCRTNLDGYESEQWPTIFAAVPRVGECVQAKSGKRLKVARVTHAVVEDSFLQTGQRPDIEVELGKVI